MKNVVIAPVGDNLSPLYLGIKEFPTERIYLICPPNKKQEAENAKKDFSKFHIPVIIKDLPNNNIENMLAIVSQICSIEKDSNLIVNVATGDKMSTCAATCAAFVNGLRAFGVMNNEVILMPLLKFSYYKLLTDKKLKLLKTLENREYGLEELSKTLKMSLPLISYHIHGTLKSDGLIGLGLIEIYEKKNRTYVKLSSLGRLLTRGYISN